jgi:hypothetical protein
MIYFLIHLFVTKVTPIDSGRARDFSATKCVKALDWIILRNTQKQFTF